jgi:hypothetical protein
MFRYLPKLLLLLLFLFFTACTVTPSNISQSRVEALSKLLKSLDGSISSKEVRSLSSEIFQETGKLRKKFNPTSQAHFNNFLINAGVKEKGLCYDWSDALYLHFSRKQYENFEFHLLVAHEGKYFYEHNTLVVVAKGGKVLEGIVIDPWRNSGKLYFSKVSEDKKYDWRHRSKRGCKR